MSSKQVNSLTAQYAKWNNIEISDDEKDFHPNIDNESFVRMKRRTREHREAENAQERAELEKVVKENEGPMKELKAKMDSLDAAKDEYKEVRKKYKKMEREVDAAKERLRKMDREKKWHVGNMCKVVEDRTIINSGANELKSNVDERPPTNTETYEPYVKQHDDKIEKFMSFTTDKASEFYLIENNILLHEHAHTYMVLKALELEMSGKTKEMKVAARQLTLLQYILELSTSMRKDPRDVVRSFFRKIEQNKDEYVDGFNDGVKQFVDRVRKRAQEKLKEMRESGELKDEDIQYVEVDDDEKVLGPGGLDPIEVFETLPPAWQEAFSSKETEKLQEALSVTDPEEAQYHMKRCIDSGLWVPGGED